ncbi:MAG: glycolate oxidase subunit GlcF [Bauldia sp.]|uniref:glycolate oxidase subunit GlcF n=1 Tax=Bauldia sp. TaxID=2575872 RepID=UPI001E12BE56|nr:glycolate oxidase subunit GlcF [Bauldia sp.]MCB1498047.1 glycolate oxidase subunit GlcF [Bauldia sp.]
MQTNFTLAQLADPDVATSEKILRTCVHCGFCTATCPTYLLLGDELDSPRGRIYLIKDMLEGDKPANKEVTTHIDRCLSCLACMTTCPSGVDYMHLVDHARARIHETYRRPWFDRTMRNVLAAVLPYPGRFRAALGLAWFGKPFRGLFRMLPGLSKVAAMLSLAPGKLPPRSNADRPDVFDAEGERTGRVVLLRGCAQSVLDPGINDAAIRLLTRKGVEVVLAEGEGCCGALVHHMGRSGESHAQVKRNIDAWTRVIENGGLDAILVTTSGCGTTVKDYGFILRNDAAYAEKAAAVSALAKDISEYLDVLGLGEPARASGLTVAYHAACSLQHGQQVTVAPKALLEKAGFVVREPAESHICCGSAGTYNLLQPELAGRLRDRKVGHIEATAPQLVAAGNIGCITQIGSGTDLPVVHTVELLDWAYGGPRPEKLSTLGPE